MNKRGSSIKGQVKRKNTSSREIETFQTDIHRQLLLQMAPTERKNALVYLETLRGAMEAVKEKLL